LSADEVGAEGRLACCESCGTSWLARHHHEEKLRQALKALPRQPLIIEGELAPRRLAAATTADGRRAAAPAGASRSSPHPVGERRERDARPEPSHGRAEYRRVEGGAGVPSPRALFAETDRPGWPAGRRRLGPVLFALAVTIVAAFAAPTVTALPGVAEFFAADALEFIGVRSTFLSVRGAPAILVEGELQNASGRAVAVPAIRISLRDAAGGEVYAWSVEPAVAALAAGGSLGFRSALAAPPPEGDHVALSFADRSGTIVGMR
jgi:hypothetical protein